MPWQVVFARRALRDLEGISPSMRATIVRRIREAAVDPSSADLAKLAGRPGEWRIRVGSWRVIVELDTAAGQFSVTRVLPRRDAYR